MCRILSVCLGMTFLASTAFAHDTWVQTNTNVVRVGDSVHVDLMLGNHGNDHRDFKLASKTALDACTLAVLSPDSKPYDIKSELVDLGYAPKEGFWSARFTPAEPGLYTVAHTIDKVVNHGEPVRSIKSGKTLFVASESLDKVSQKNPGFDRALGHPLELVPTVNPVTPMGPGMPLKVQLLLKGKPLADAKVSFIPRGETLAEGFDEQFERKTDAAGRASFTPKSGNYYLVVAHHLSPDEKGKDYTSTKYSATLAVFVPQLCPCCNE